MYLEISASLEYRGPTDFCQIGIKIKLAALEGIQNRCLYFFSGAIDEFEFRPDPTIYSEVSCPWVLEKYPINLKLESDISMLACSFLIELSSKLLVTAT